MKPARSAPQLAEKHSIDAPHVPHVEILQKAPDEHAHHAAERHNRNARASRRAVRVRENGLHVELQVDESLQSDEGQGTHDKENGVAIGKLGPMTFRTDAKTMMREHSTF